MPPSNPARTSKATPLRLFRLALAISLTVSALLFFLWSWRWPLVGDSALIHYIAFLIERHWAPYRQLADQQFPGSYLIELAAMHIFGMGDLAWRLFDFSLLAAAAASFFAVTTEPGAPSKLRLGGSTATCHPDTPILKASVGATARWLPGLFAASLFILIHGRDGLAEGGQRDLTMAVLLLAATAFLFTAARRNSLWASAIFGLLSGIAFTIKPTVLPLSLAQLALACYVLRRRGIPWLAPAISAALAYLVAPAIAVLFLLREHAFRAFLAGFHGIVPYYASLAHRPLSYIVLHSVSPVLPLVLIWFALLAVNRRPPGTPHDWQRTALAVGVLFGLIDCILQARALPYYRYPLLAFLLPLMALDFTRALRTPAVTLRAKSAAILAVIALSFGGFFLAPQSALLIHRYRWWETDFISSLQQNLTSLGGPALSGHIQCIDSISGCDTVLYRMRLEQSTGLLADYVLFGPDTVPVIRETRQWFAADLLANPPQVIVVSSWLHFDGPGNYRKLDRWPALADFLSTRYTLQTEWTPYRTNKWWGREETPASYRIYVLRPTSSP
jgi:hypothetical protein